MKFQFLNLKSQTDKGKPYNSEMQNAKQNNPPRWTLVYLIVTNVTIFSMIIVI